MDADEASQASEFVSIRLPIALVWIICHLKTHPTGAQYQETGSCAGIAADGPPRLPAPPAHLA